MAKQELYQAIFGSQWGDVSLTLSFDDVTLQVLSLDYINPSPLPGTLTLAGQLNRVITTQVNTTASVDLTPANVICIQTQVTGKFGTFTQTELPGNETIQFVWPS